MNTISMKIQEAYADYAICKDKSAYGLFSGRNLPTFVKDYILNRFSNGEERDEEGIREYLAAKMPQNSDSLMMRLLEGENVNITTRIVVKTKLDDGMVAFMLPDLNISANMFIQPKVVADNRNDLVDGENWGNITMQYMPPEGKKKGYVLMTSYKSFNPYKNLNFEDFLSRRALFSTEEWIDVLLTTMGYTPDSFPSFEAKFTMITRLLPAIEPNLNFIELGPKSSGKSFTYNNLSQYFRMISGKCTRAQLIYNHSTKQYGAIKNHDLIVFDEVSTLKFDDRTGELQGFLKSFLEAGTASLTDIKIVSSCGLGLAGNIALTEDMQPVNEDFQQVLPDIFRSSAMMDRFHLFIPGWRLPKISEGQLYYGWAIDAEVFSEYLHFMRTETYSQNIFDELVEYDKNAAYVRHAKAVKKIATAYCKLLFPHIETINGMAEEDLATFKKLYKEYCLLPAIEARSYIYEQCKLVDSEYKYNSLPEFSIIDDVAEEEQGADE
ncbi:MAG: BREX system Lon protease-like protein BrxL [Bacteroidaceae bacterium]|nr:BREX system Lon protease-like protein BrxL [Bacteroidaceae bacterium]